MAAKQHGISRDLIIHPGETIADVLEERGISQAELATCTGVTPVYVSNVIHGKKDISAKFAIALEYALGVPKSFWINLQAHYDAELLAYNEKQSITDEERAVRDSLKDVVKFFRKEGRMPEGETKDDSILSLRKALRISNLVNVREIVPAGAFRMGSHGAVNMDVLGAWVRLCQITMENKQATGYFQVGDVGKLTKELKKVMTEDDHNICENLQYVFAKYGIIFDVVRNFRGAPVQGYVASKQNGSYQMAVTLRNAYKDIFWFSVFHELGHIVNGDVGKNSKFLDDETEKDKEDAADAFARESLISEEDYQVFTYKGSFTIKSIKKFAASQNVMPYIVIGRLQKEKKLPYDRFVKYKETYKWAE